MKNAVMAFAMLDKRGGTKVQVTRIEMLAKARFQDLYRAPLLRGGVIAGFAHFVLAGCVGFLAAGVCRALSTPSVLCEHLVQ